MAERPLQTGIDQLGSKMQPELAGRGMVALHQEYRADDRVAALGYPGVLLRGIEMRDEVAENFADQPLEGRVSTVLRA
jgi:hypothetical protein